MKKTKREKIIMRASVMSVLLLVFLFISVMIVTAAGCNNENTDGITGNNSGDNVSVGFYSENSAGDNVLSITEAKFVLRKVVLGNEHGDNGGDCDVKLGPFVVYLDMTQKVGIAAMAKIPLGTFDEIKFQVHKPSPNEGIGDPDFFESNSRRFSVVVKGFFNGNFFVFKSDVTVAKEIEFEGQPVIIGAVPVVNLTIRLSPYLWFMQEGVLIDPLDENNKNIIDQNIKNSLRRAFRDLDLNGEPD